MKKIILSAAAVFAFGFASAQEAEGTGTKGFANGDVFVTGSVGFSSQTTGDYKTSTFEIMPQVGIFVTDNIVVGAVIGYSSTTQPVSAFDPNLVDVDQKTSALAVGAFGRYYATPASDFSFFGELSFVYVTATSEIDQAGSEEFKANGFGLGLRPAVSYFISNNFALEASIGALEYNTTKPDFEGAESTDNFDLNFNLTDIRFGLVYKF
ncbi:MAG TPA: outer membrane beta-barrel protein [Flavobacterium sp.]|jgi:hypothetical protein